MKKIIITLLTLSFRVALNTNIKKKLQGATLMELKGKYPSIFNDYGFKIQRYFLTSKKANKMAFLLQKLN